MYRVHHHQQQQHCHGHLALVHRLLSVRVCVCTLLFATRFAEQHRRLLNAYVRHTPSLLEASLRLLLKAPRLIDFDNKRSHFRGRIRASHDDRCVQR